MASSSKSQRPPPGPTSNRDRKTGIKHSLLVSRLFLFVGAILSISFLIVQHVHILQIFIENESVNQIRREDFGRGIPVTMQSSSSIFENTKNNSTKNNNTTIMRYTQRRSSQIQGSVAMMRNITDYFDESIQEFERQDGVVIATKIHDEAYLPMLEQMLCLLHQAYNHRVLYDIVVFTTEKIAPSLATKLHQTVSPAKLTILQDNRGLPAEIAALSPDRRKRFMKDCGLTSEADLVNVTWWSKCPHRLAYNWQAEFRSWHIWNHPALKEYQWMMWLDADAFCAKKWTNDPIAIAMQHNLTIFFDNFPQGSGNDREIQRRIHNAMGGGMCDVKVNSLGYFDRNLNCSDDRAFFNIPLIHGFFHITNLEFYRRHIYWSKILIGSGFLQRKFDDQMAVTIPAAYLTPKSSWLMRKVGITLDVYHNGKLDGFVKMPGGGFKRVWNKKGGKERFPEGDQACIVISGG